MILENLNKEKIEEPLRTPIAQKEAEGTFSTEYSKISIAYHQLVRDIDELEATLSVSVAILFHAINKPQQELVNLNQYKKKRNAQEIYDEALSVLNEVTKLKEEIRSKDWKYIESHIEDLYNRQGRFKF
jgi:hypothetical protein